MTQQIHRIPVVVTQDHGGPFDNDAFVSGYVIGALHAQLRLHRTVHPVMVPEGALPQIDLLTMAYGYEMSRIEAEKPGWVIVAFAKLADEDITPENAILPPAV